MVKEKSDIKKLSKRTKKKIKEIYEMSEIANIPDYTPIPPVQKEEQNLLDETFKKPLPSKQELEEKQAELLKELKKKPLAHNPYNTSNVSEYIAKIQQNHNPYNTSPTKPKNDLDYLEILLELAKDPMLDECFFIPEEMKKFFDKNHKRKNEIKTLLWIRLTTTLKKVPAWCIDDYELLFCILSFVIPMKHAHRLTKYLLDKYETLENVLTAPNKELQELLFRHDDALILLDLVYALLYKYTIEYEQ